MNVFCLFNSSNQLLGVYRHRKVPEFLIEQAETHVTNHGYYISTYVLEDWDNHDEEVAR